MSRPRQLLIAALVAITAPGCGSKTEDTYVRGHGLRVADLPVHDRVAIYQAAIGGAFTIGDPSLYLLLDPRLLPRTEGYAGTAGMSQALRTAVLESHIVQGTCQPPIEETPHIAHCQAPMAGYVVRFSEVFRMPHDTMEVYLAVRRYSTPTTVGIGRLEFERVYKVVKHGAAWDAVAEGRIEHAPAGATH